MNEGSEKETNLEGIKKVEEKIKSVERGEKKEKNSTSNSVGLSQRLLHS